MAIQNSLTFRSAVQVSPSTTLVVTNSKTLQTNLTQSIVTIASLENDALAYAIALG